MRRNLDHLLATEPQWAYVRRLMLEAFAKGYRGKDLPNIDTHHQPTYYTKADASADIRALLSIKARGWK